MRIERGGRLRPALPVLAEGPGWLVVAKPPRTLVHRTALEPRALAALQIVRGMVGRRVYPIHRLDRPASGCLLFATDAALAGPLSAALAAGQKEYLAFVRGAARWEGVRRVETPMKDPLGTLKQACSDVAVLGASDEPRCALLRVWPRTGRFHQVRRHCRDLGHPLVGDTAHGDSRVNRWWRENGGVTRLGLHAARLCLPAPGGGEIVAECPLFDDQADAFARLPFWSAAIDAWPLLGRSPLPIPDWGPAPRATTPDEAAAAAEDTADDGAAALPEDA